MVTVRISEECGDLLKKMAEKARRSLCKQVEAMILSQKQAIEKNDYDQAWNDAENQKNLTEIGKIASFEDALIKLGL